jgi:hypothetical protein
MDMGSLTMVVDGKDSFDRYFKIVGKNQFRARGYTGIQACTHVKVGGKVYFMDNMRSLPQNIVEGTLKESI